MSSPSDIKFIEESLSSNQSKLSLLFGGVILSGLVVVMYAPVIGGLASQWWDDPNYSHGMLVPVFAGYLLWQQRSRWLGTPVRPSNAGLATMLSALGLLMLGMLSAELFTTRMSLIVMIAGTIVFLAGWKVLRSVAFPIGYLIFMIPLPALVYYQLTFPLQLLASRFGAEGLIAVGIHTVRQGNLLILPNVTLEVVEACSGVRSLISLLAASVAYSYLAEKSLWKRCVLVALTVPVVILSNGFRLVATGVLSYIYGPRVDTGSLHSLLGLAFFAAAFLAIIGIHRGLQRISPNRIAVS